MIQFIDKLEDDKISQFKVKCKCGHTMFILNKQGKVICSWCKNYVYRDKKEEFKDKLKRELRYKSYENK